MTFTLKHLVSIGNTFNWLPFCELTSILKVTGSHVSKLLILLCNATTIEASVLVGNTLLGYFLVYFNVDFLNFDIVQNGWSPPIFSTRKAYLALLLKIIEDGDFCLKYIIRLLFGLVYCGLFEISILSNRLLYLLLIKHILHYFSKTREASTFAGNILLCYFLV